MEEKQKKKKESVSNLNAFDENDMGNGFMTNGYLINDPKDYEILTHNYHN